MPSSKKTKLGLNLWQDDDHFDFCDLNNDNEKINALVEDKADKTEVYTKTQTDNLALTTLNDSKTYTDQKVVAIGSADMQKSIYDTGNKSTDFFKYADSLASNKADKATTYTKAETDTNLALKADKTTTYTKTQVDNIATLKADKTEIYTKTQTDNLTLTTLNDSKTYTDQKVVAIGSADMQKSIYDTGNKSTDFFKYADSLASNKADKATTYTKAEVDTNLALKADKTTTYTKTQVDNIATLKADKTEIYTKTQTDNLTLTTLNDSKTYTDQKVVAIGSSDMQKSIYDTGNKSTDFFKYADSLASNKADKTTTYTKAETDTILSNKEPLIITKNTAFNKNFGDVLGTVCEGNDVRLSDARPASDVQAWAKTTNKPNYTAGEVGAYNKTETYTKTETYNKTEVDTSLSKKADKATTYLKTEVDSSLALKADKSTIPTSLPASGGTSEYAQKAVSTQDLGGFFARNIAISTADPVNGQNGDVWIKYS